MVSCSNDVYRCTHNVSERYADRCSIDERCKTKMFCFWRDIMSLVGYLTLLCFSTLFYFSSLSFIGGLQKWCRCIGCTHNIGERNVVPMREVKLKFPAFGGISYIWWTSYVFLERNK